MINSVSTFPVRPLFLIALVATMFAPGLSGKVADRATASPAAEPAASAPIVLAQRCYTVNGQLRCF